MTVSGLALAFAIAFSGRWHVSAFAAGALTRTVITDAWTGGIVICTTVHSTASAAEGRTACIPETRP
nr:hypothetical protein [Methylobacterium sp. L1A1]